MISRVGVGVVRSLELRLAKSDLWRMIFHASIPARDTERVAGVLAELLQGRVRPFYRPDSYLALSGKDPAHMIEVLPVDHRAFKHQSAARELYDSMHFAMAVDLDPQEVIKIGKREGWTTRRCTRGGSFDVIELWLEDHFLIEVLTPEMQMQYQKAMRG